jgi:hypothetical protein
MLESVGNVIIQNCEIFMAVANTGGFLYMINIYGIYNVTIQNSNIKYTSATLKGGAIAIVDSGPFFLNLN